MNKDLSIILPIYNEKDSLPIMVRILNSTIKFEKEIIIVYDSEKDTYCLTKESCLQTRAAYQSFFFLSPATLPMHGRYATLRRGSGSR